MSEVLTTDDEKEILSREDAKDLAVACREKPDSFDLISPSLLSAEHIEKYVEKTGLISPYFRGGKEKSRLKKAAYEGRIGTCAYMYNENSQLVNIPLKDSLLVPANSIVFVECDLDFRLPEYIALRFNLQIRHVHRGLLLGTGPLVDPGYWGKLCIPLHNLTDEDYEIPLNEGLIWLEFTKTTSNLKDEEAIGRPPLEKEFWDIRDFIEKAAQPFNQKLKPVSIRSSIPLMVNKANERSEEALSKSADASQSAKVAEKAARNVRNISFLAAIGVVAATIFGTVGLWYSFYSGMNSQFETVRSLVDQLYRDVAGNSISIDGAVQRSTGAQSEISTVLNELQNANSRILELEEINDELISRIENLEIDIESQDSEADEAQ